MVFARTALPLRPGAGGAPTQSAPRRILFVTFDTIGARLGGSAVRVLGLARALAAAGHSSTVAAPVIRADAGCESFALHAFDPARPREILKPLAVQAEALVLPPHGLVRLPFLASVGRPLVIDLYDPFLLELLESDPDAPDGERIRRLRSHTAVLNHVLRRGDFFLCASERQRDLWLGALAANGRLEPATGSRKADPEFRDLIDVVPFGISPVLPPPRSSARPTLTAAFPALRPSGTVIVWGGGFRDWLDPGTLIRAIARLASRLPDVQLVMFAGTHPTPDQIGIAAARRTRELASRLGVAGRQVFFLDDYVPYEERGSYLSECDLGVSTHQKNLESRFAFRTRILDYFWAGLPVLCTKGDVLADLVERRGLGIVVPEGDEDELATAIERLASDAPLREACRERLADVRSSLGWDLAARPLVRFCSAPHVRRRGSDSVASATALAAAGWRILVSHGPREALRRVRGHFFVRS